MELEKRNVNFDILKLISMFMIVILHALGHSGVLNYDIYAGAGSQIWILEAISIVAVNCYVLISGYFLFEGKFRLNKVFKLWFEIFVFSLIALIFVISAKIVPFSFGIFFKSITPILSRQYWFVTVYIIMYIFSPYINLLLKSLSKEQFKKLVISIIIIFSVVPTIFNYSSYMDIYGGGTGIVWFFCLYCVGAYIKMYGHEFTKKNLYLLSFCVFTCITFCIGVLPFFTKTLQFNNLFVIASQYYMNYSTFIVFLQSVFLFLYFLNIKPKLAYKVKKVIINLSIVSLGVYLLHDNEFIRTWLWNEVDLPALISKSDFALYEVIKVVSIVYLSCLILSYIINFCLQKVYKKLVRRKKERFE